MTWVTNAIREGQEGWVVLAEKIKEGFQEVVVNFHLGLRRLNSLTEGRVGHPGLGAKGTNTEADKCQVCYEASHLEVKWDKHSRTESEAGEFFGTTSKRLL